LTAHNNSLKIELTSIHSGGTRYAIHQPDYIGQQNADAGADDLSEHLPHRKLADKGTDLY
jgi:hypothetical protein